MMRSPPLARRLAGSVAVAVALGVATSASAASTEAQKIGVGVIAQLRQATQAARERANAIGAAPSLVYAVATDQQTMLDMTAEELPFHAQPNEIVEVGQRQLASGKIVSLRREGSDETLVHLPLDLTGQSVIAAGDRLYALAVVEVRPRERANVVRGVVGVALAIDLSAVSARLTQLGAGIRVETSNGSVLLGTRPSSATSQVLHESLGTDDDPRVTLLVPGSSAGLFGILTAIGLGAFAGAFVFLRRRRAGHHGELAVR
jgi:hypothetical protein